MGSANDEGGTLGDKVHNATQRVRAKIEEVAEGAVQRLADGGAKAPAFVGNPTVEPSSNSTVPLVAVASFRTKGELQRVVVRAVASDHTREQIFHASGHKHEIAFWGLRAGRSYSVSIGLAGVDGTVWSEPISYRTPKLPDDLPALSLETAVSAAMEPGVVLFPVIRFLDDESGPDDKFTLLLVVDAQGQVVWLYKDTAGSIDDVRQLESGNLLFNRGALEICEMGLDGEIHGLWGATGIVPRTSEGAVRVSVNAFHHEVYPLDDRTLLTLSCAVRRVPNFPTSTDDPSAPTETANVAGDLIVEIDRESGELKNSIALLDVLIPTRIGYNSLDGTWDKMYPLAKGGTRDWAHANAVIHDRSDDTLIVSARHQDAIVKLRRDTGEVVWILGVNEDWGPLSDRVLRPVGKTIVPYHTHAPALTSRGTLLVHDNGTYRARPYKQKLPATSNRSRAVEFRVDEQARTFEEVWAFEGDPKDSFYTHYVGDADPMPRTGNVLVTQGGIVEVDGEVSDEVFAGHHRSAIWEVTREATPTVVFHLRVGDKDPGRVGWYVYRSEKLSHW